jgi:hypothetical protein
MHKFSAFRCVLLLTILMQASSRTTLADAPATQPSVEPKQMESWWEDLAKGDPEASRALLHFAAMPMQSVAFMKEHLLRLKISDEVMNKLLTDLGSDDELVWKSAFEQLEYFDPRLNKDLPTLMDDVADPPARNRLVALLCDEPADTYTGKHIRLTPSGGVIGEYNFVAGNSAWWAEGKVSNLSGGPVWERGKKKWTRAVRAIVLLENIGTPDAMAIVRDMATGNEDAQPTKVAKQVLGIPVDNQKQQ